METTNNYAHIIHTRKSEMTGAKNFLLQLTTELDKQDGFLDIALNTFTYDVFKQLIEPLALTPTEREQQITFNIIKHTLTDVAKTYGIDITLKVLPYITISSKMTAILSEYSTLEYMLSTSSNFTSMYMQNTIEETLRKYQYIYA